MAGIGLRLFRQSHHGQKFQGPLGDDLPVLLENQPRRLHQVLKDGHMREQVEVLEDHANVGPVLTDLLVLLFVQPGALDVIADDFSVDPHPPTVNTLEMVDTAQESALARSRRADEADHFTGLNLKVQTFKDLKFAVVFLDSVGPHHGPVLQRWGCQSSHSFPPFRLGRSLPLKPFRPSRSWVLRKKRNFCHGVRGRFRCPPLANLRSR